MSAHDLDLAIVGGGPAGLATALFLAAAAPSLRDRIAVLEKERYPRDKICAGAIGARADRLLAAIGVSVDVPSVPIYGLSVAAPGRALVARDRAPLGPVVPRIELDAALPEQAPARGVAVLEGAPVTALQVAADGVRLATGRGEIRARAVVGADGVGSFVRRAIGIGCGRLRAQVVEVDTPMIDGDAPRDRLHFDVVDRSLAGYAWDFPTLVGGQALVCRGVYRIHDAGSGLGRERGLDDDPHQADLAARLSARLVGLGVDPAGLRFKRFAERGLALHEPIARPRVLLVGEAAGIDPVLGEGIAQAIQYGAAAGRYLARCLASGELGFEGWRFAIAGSRVGFDLAVRTRLLPWVYGARSRPVVERLITRSQSLALAGMRYFAGERVPRLRLLAAAGDLGAALAGR